MVEMIHRIKINVLRNIIRESINTWRKNHHTSYDDPFGIEDAYDMELDVQKYANTDGSWSVKINCGWDDSLSEPLRVFKTGDDADAYANRKSSDIYKAYLNSGNL